MINISRAITSASPFTAFMRIRLRRHFDIDDVSLATYTHSVALASTRASFPTV